MRLLLILILGMGTFLVSQISPAHKLNINVSHQFLGLGWNPILVEIENLETTPFEGEIWVDNKDRKRTRYSSNTDQTEVFRKLQIPPQTKKRFWMYLFSNEYMYEVSWKIRAKNAETVLYQGAIPVSYQPYNDFQILTLSTEKNLFHHFHQQFSTYVSTRNYYSSQATIKVFHGEKDILPDRREGYDPLHLVVLNQFPLEGDMTVPQINALKEWVAEGGAVLLSPGSESWIQSPLFQELFPVTLEKTETKTPEETNDQGFSLHQFDSLTGEARKATYLYYHFKYPETTKFFVPAEEDVQNAKEIVSEPTHIGYLARYPYGKGWVYLTPFDVSRYPLKTWGKEFYDKYLFKNCPPLKSTEITNDAMYQFIAPEKRVSLLNFFFLLVAYLLLMGPIQYYLLYRWKIRSYLLLSVTFFSFLCVGLVLIFGYYSYGGQETYQMCTFITGAPHHQIETSLLSISSKRNQVYSISGESRTSIHLLLPSRERNSTLTSLYNQTEGKMEIQIPIGLWNNRSFQFRTHHISPQLHYPLEITKSTEMLEIQALEDVEGFYVYNSQFRIIYAREEKFSIKEGSLQIPLSSKNTLPESKELYKLRISLGDRFYPSNGFILIRYPKPKHQIQVNGETIHPQKNQTFFIQPL